MKRQRAIWEYFPSHVLKQFEERRNRNSNSIQPSIRPSEQPTHRTNTEPAYINIDYNEDDENDEEILYQLIQMVDDDNYEKIEKPSIPVLLTDEERIKKLDEFRESLIKEVETKKSLVNKKQRLYEPLDSNTLARIRSNREYNEAVPSILTIDCILSTILNFASVECFVLLQSTSYRLHTLINGLLRTVKYPCIRIDKKTTLTTLFNRKMKNGILESFRKNVRVIAYKPRNTTVLEEENEKPSTKTDIFGVLPLLQKIIVNIRQPEDIDELLRTYAFYHKDFHIFYCPGRLVARPDLLTSRFYGHIIDNYKEIHSVSVIYDPYGLRFDAIENTIVPNLDQKKNTVIQ